MIPPILTTTKATLERVIAEDAFVCTTNQARSELARVNFYIANPTRWDEAAIVFGPNQRGPLIESIAKDAAIHARENSRSEAA